MVSGEKRNCDEENVLERINTILLDIEGTTTAISYVKDTLFPYVRDNLNTYIDSHWDDEEFKADLKALKEQAKKDEEDKIDGFCAIEEGEKEKETLEKNILWQMDLDRKTTALKQLQGHIWREGYENGKLKGHVYSEVAQLFKKWNEEGRKLYIYSSGSVEAQKLLFKNSESGDLQSFISGYFDTEIGPKTEASSYTNIAKSVGCDSNQILFLTDVVKEAVAADKAGMQVMIVLRSGNSPLTDDEKKAFATITNFKDIVFESSNKKKKISEEENVGKETAKVQNDEKMEEAAEVKNGETEKMEVETNETNTEDCKEETKTEEEGQDKTEPSTKSPDADSENIEVDVDDSNCETGAGEKVVSSSVDDNEANKEEEENVEKANVENAKEEETKVEETVNKEENVDSTNETPVHENNEEVKEPQEDGENSKSNVAEEKEAKSINGHENGEHKEENGKEESEEGNTEASEKPEGEVETLPVKKVPAEEQADSTVEVTA